MNPNFFRLFIVNWATVIVVYWMHMWFVLPHVLQTNHILCLQCKTVDILKG